MPETTAFRCTRCNMRDRTDDLTVIGRNCWAADFEQPHVMVPTVLLPVEEEFVRTSAEFGHSVIVEVSYNTDENGAWVADDLDWDRLPRTLHGPFADEDEAQTWIDGMPDGDKDVNDVRTLTLNNVRPTTV